VIPDSAILDAFFEECEDLLLALTDGLAQMCEGQADNETVNAVFRAVHSIKGAAGAFSMDELVGFAHKFETVLDTLRADKIAASDDLLRVLQRAGDILSDLVDHARDDVSADRSRVDPVLTELEAFLEDEAGPEEEFVFEALTLDFSEATARTYEINFHPTAEFYACGNDPLLVLRALTDLGPSEIACDTAKLPQSPDKFEFTNGYLAWKITLQDQVNDLAIRDVFEFIEDLCAVTFRDVMAASLGVQTHGPTITAPLLPHATPKEQEPIIEQEPKPEIARRTTRGANKPASTLRVDPARVDRLINAVGELIINQSVISQRIDEADMPPSTALQTDLEDYKLLAREIQEGVMAIRAQPVRPLFQRMLRIAREAADATGKQIEMITEGETTEVDKIVVERLADPLTHMIRNAIDHGIETPSGRLANQKPEKGLLKLRAHQSSGSIIIQIIDDGAGLNRPKIQEIAVSKGLISANDQLTESEIDHLLFAPGFSTAAEVTNLSGRGVGMDVVKTAISDLGGKIAISSLQGKGTTFSITLPLSLAVMEGMVINVSGQTLVVPIANILETVRPRRADLSKIGQNTDLLHVRGQYVPIVDLALYLGGIVSDIPLTKRVLLLIHHDSVVQFALAVDQIFDQRQVVVKSMSDNYRTIPGISGATILGDGKIALIVDPEIEKPMAGSAYKAQPPEGTQHVNHC